MADLKLGDSLGTYQTREEAIAAARDHAGDEAIVRTRDNEFEVRALERTGTQGAELLEIASNEATPQLTMAANFDPNCTDFVVDGRNGRKAVIQNYDIGSFVRRQQVQTDFANMPADQKVGFWETAYAFAFSRGGVGPDEMAVLRQLARDIGNASPPPDAATLGRLNADLARMADTCAAEDRATLSGILDRARQDPSSVTPEEMRRASAAICRSFGPEHLSLARQLLDVLPQNTETTSAPEYVTRFRMVAHEFVDPLPGVEIQNGRYVNPAAMMEFGQRDHLSATRMDTARCGAASLVAGALVMGPAALQRLADHFGVPVDVNAPTAGSLHMLMEQVYVQTRMAHPDGDQPGLSNVQASDLLALIGGPVSPMQLGDPQSLDLSGIGAAMMAVGGSSGDHAILFFRDPQSGHLAMYQPEIFGNAATVFRDEAEARRFLAANSMLSHPGEVMLIGSVP